MFEVWVIAEGNGRGELIVADAKADMPSQLRRRLRKVGPGAFPTEQEAARFRWEYQAANDPARRGPAPRARAGR